uniref:CSON008495 protein n=1 Tax=Culicoides sonorensis TaxID=179676 RepID=A0A336KP99_CULSO
MAKPNIVVKVRRPTDEFNASDSDFEVLSDSGNENDDSVMENNYERLDDEIVDAVTLHKPPFESNNIDQNSDVTFTRDEKIVVSLNSRQITGDNFENRLEVRENREKKSLSLVMLSKEMTLLDVAVPSSADTPQNYISRSVSSNFAERLNTALMRRNAIANPDEIKHSLSSFKLCNSIKAPIPAARKMSDSVVLDRSKNLLITPEPVRKNSDSALLQPKSLIDTSSEDVSQHDEETKPTPTSRWSFYRAIGSAAVDKIRDEPITGQKSTKASTSRALDRQHSETINDFIPDKFKCYLCKSVFKDPRVLDCLHNFCYECLNQIDMNRNAAANQFWSRYSNAISDKKDTSLSGSITSGDEHSLNRSPQGSRNKRLSKVRSKSLASNRRKSSGVSFNEKPKNIVCPICGTATELPVGGLSRVPQNFLMSRQVEQAITKTGVQQVARIWCNLCSTDTIASAFCITCGYNLCNFCKEAHKRQRTSCNHEIKIFVESNKKSIKKSSESLQRTFHCPIHSNNELKIFCTNCHQVLCNDCTILLHRGHKYITLAKASKIYMKILMENLERTKPLTEYALHSKLKNNETSKKISQKCIDVQSEVEQFLSEYFQALEVHKNTLLNQIAKARENKMEVLLARQADLDRRCQEAKTAITFAEELLDQGSEIEKLSFVGILTKRLEHCQKSEPSMELKVNDSLQFLPEVKAPSNKAQNNIPLYGIITTQTASAKLCCLEKTDGLT